MLRLTSLGRFLEHLDTRYAFRLSCSSLLTPGAEKVLTVLRTNSLREFTESMEKSLTDDFPSIWAKFIPFPSYQVFQRGAYFSVEVIPNAVAVISLNTMYFYDSNKGTPRPTLRTRHVN